MHTLGIYEHHNKVSWSNYDCQACVPWNHIHHKHFSISFIFPSSSCMSIIADIVNATGSPQHCGYTAYCFSHKLTTAKLKFMVHSAGSQVYIVTYIAKVWWFDSIHMRVCFYYINAPVYIRPCNSCTIRLNPIINSIVQLKSFS